MLNAQRFNVKAASRAESLDLTTVNGAHMVEGNSHKQQLTKQQHTWHTHAHTEGDTHVVTHSRLAFGKPDEVEEEADDDSIRSAFNSSWMNHSLWRFLCSFYCSQREVLLLLWLLLLLLLSPCCCCLTCCCCVPCCCCPLVAVAVVSRLLLLLLCRGDSVSVVALL